MRRALITGVFGQDGSYLAERLTLEGYEVHGVARPSSSSHAISIQRHLASKGVVPELHGCDLLDPDEVTALVHRVQPEECYHLAAAHYSSEVLPSEQAQRDRALYEFNSLSTLNLLSAIRQAAPETRFVLAGSCLMYDASDQSPQNESMPYASRSLYGLSKVAGARLVEYFSAVHEMHASVAILYNHESPRRGASFVTRKIVRGLVAVRNGRAPCLELGNLDGLKDWGWAPDYVDGMSRMARADCPGSWILATGVSHSVEDFVRMAAGALGYSDYREVVVVDSDLTRRPDSVALVGDAARAGRDLDWHSTVPLPQLIERMIECELSGSLD